MRHRLRPPLSLAIRPVGLFNISRNNALVLTPGYRSLVVSFYRDLERTLGSRSLRYRRICWKSKYRRDQSTEYRRQKRNDLFIGLIMERRRTFPWTSIRQDVYKWSVNYHSIYPFEGCVSEIKNNERRRLETTIESAVIGFLVLQLALSK